MPPKRLRHAYTGCSLTPCLFATSPTDVRSASRNIFTLCSSVNPLLRSVLSRSVGELVFLHRQWSEISRAGHRSALSGVCAGRCSDETHAAQHVDERGVGGAAEEIRDGEA